MKRVLIICSAGFSSMMMARKAEKLMEDQGLDVRIDARGIMEGKQLARQGDYDLYLLTPQTAMYLEEIKEAAAHTPERIEVLSSEAFTPSADGFETLANQIQNLLQQN